MCLAVVWLVYSVVEAVRHTILGHNGDDAHRQEARELVSELLAELEGGGVLEHTARVVLLLAPVADDEAVAVEERAHFPRMALRLGAAVSGLTEFFHIYRQRPGAIASGDDNDTNDDGKNDNGAVGTGEDADEGKGTKGIDNDGDDSDGGGGRGGPDAASLAARLRDVLTSPCVRHAVLSLGLATLHAADGGTVYGMPYELLSYLLADECRSSRDGGGSGGTGRGQRLGPECLQAMLTVLALPAIEIAPSAAAPAVGAAARRRRLAPPCLRNSLLVAMRVGWVAVASARAPAALAAAAAAGGIRAASSDAVPLPRVRLALAEDKAPIAALESLHAARCLIDSLAAPTPEGGHRALRDGELASATAEWWRLVAALARWGLRHSGEPEQHGLGVMLRLLSEADTTLRGPLRFPLSPPREVAAALAGGLLPCLELLLRRAGGAPQGPEAAVLRAFLWRPPGCVWRCLAPLLAYGDPRAAAAVAATLGKILRRTAPRCVAVPWQPWSAIEQALVHGSCDFLSAAAAALAVAAPPPVAEGPVGCTAATAPGGGENASSSPASRQFAALLSYAVCEWLPPLSRAVTKRAEELTMALALAEHLAAEGGALSGPILNAVRPILSLLAQLLPWVPVLAARCGASAAEASAATAAGASARHGAGADAASGGSGGGDGAEDAGGGGGDANGGGGGGWVELLMDEVAAVLLLAAALLLVNQVSSEACESPEQHAALLRLVVEGCVAVADVCTHVAADRTPPGASAASAVAGTAPRSPTPMQPWQAWSPPGLRALAAQLRERGFWAGAGDAERLVTWVVRERAAAAAAAAAAADAARQGAGSGGPAVSEESGAHVAAPQQQQGQHRAPAEGAGGGRAAAAASGPGAWGSCLLPPPAEARLLLPTCANPGCADLGGDSEADLALMRCSGCGRAWYCGRACQVAHWRAGHKERCGRARRGG